MPIEPREGETQDEFIERCMSEEKESIPDQDQRLAACFDMWRRDKGESEASLTQAMQQKVIDFLAQKGKDAGFQIKAQKRAAEILIYGEIGDDLFGGVSARSFADALAKAGRIDTITVRINSPGGNVFDGVAIYNTLRNHKAKVTVAIDGL